MSYNQLYDQDSGENVSYNNSYRLDVDRRNTLLPVIKGSQIVTPPPTPYTPYEYTDLMYRTDAQNISSYTLVNTNEVSFIFDLSGGDVHNFNQRLGKDFISGTSPAEYTSMTLETAINGHLCFDGFLSQGVANTFRVEPGNVLKKNMNESYTWIHVARVNEALGQWDALLCYGRNLDSLTLSCNAGQNNTLFPA